MLGLKLSQVIFQRIEQQLGIGWGERDALSDLAAWVVGEDLQELEAEFAVGAIDDGGVGLGRGLISRIFNA